jgi:hypothetical protein
VYHQVRPKWILKLCYVWHKIVHQSCADTYTVLKRTKQDSTWPTSPRSCIWCVQNDFWASGMFGANHAPILCQDQHYLETDWNELSLEPHNLGVPTGASKMISELMVHLAQRIHLSCTNTNIVSKWTEKRFHMTHVTKEFHLVCPKWFSRPWYIWPKPCTYLASRLELSPNDWNELPLEPLNLGVPSGASKMISELIVR